MRKLLAATALSVFIATGVLAGDVDGPPKSCGQNCSAVTGSNPATAVLLAVQALLSLIK